MKKFKLVFLFVALFTLVFVAACDDKPSNDSNDETNDTADEKTTYTVSFYNSDGSLYENVTVEENTYVTFPNDPVKPGYEFKGWFTDSECKNFYIEDKIVKNISLYAKHELGQYTIKFNTDGGNSFENINYTYFDEFTLPIPSKDNAIFTHWVDQNNKVYNNIKEGTFGDLNLKAVYRNPSLISCEFSTEAKNHNTGMMSNKTDGLFTIFAEVRGRIATWTNPEDENDSITFDKSYKVNDSAYEISFTAPGDGVLSFYVQNGSSSANEQNVVVKCSDNTSKSYRFSGVNAVAPYPAGSPIVKITHEIEKGKKYSIVRSSGTIDIFMASIDVDVNEENTTDISIANTGKINYIEGEEFDYSELEINSIHGDNLYYDSVNLDNVMVDYSNFDSTKSGQYDITVSYGQYSEVYKVNVFGVEDITLGFNETYISNNSYNQIYINGKVKTLYAINDEINLDYLTVTANCKQDENFMSFIVDTNITHSSLDTSTAGKKTITITYKVNNKEFNAYYDIYVVNTEPYIDSNGNYVVSVDSTYNGIIGAINEDKGNMFNTVSQALDYLQSNRVNQEANKILNIAKGKYSEKIEITTPNLTIIGEGITKATYQNDPLYDSSIYSNATIIEWDSLCGIKDESGFMQVTDSTATVHVRESALNLKIKNLTLSNYWNCEEVFQDNITYLTQMGIAVNGTVNDHRALALIVQADKFEMDGCSLLGYQDTVEFMTGRQYVYNTFISGNTDFIFGTNATTYFNSCEIYVNYKINGKGYITAYKGCNKGDEDYVQYGFIFDNCNFTADSRVTANSFALGRPWGEYTNVMIMNSQIAGHISTSADGRYVSMSGRNPSDETIKYIEYNNTGASAITSSLTCVDVINEEAASNYNNMEIIFSNTNGLVTYNDTWIPTIHTQLNS